MDYARTSAVVCATTTMMVMTIIAAARYTFPRRRTRRFKVRPLNRNRAEHGHYNTLVKFIKDKDPDQFFKYTRMTSKQFEHILIIVAQHLQKMKSKSSISPGQRLIMTLHYLSEGCSMQQIAWVYYVGLTTVHCIVKETCEVLWHVLSPIYLPQPTTQNWCNIAEGFYKCWNMPHCIGALDGKHIYIRCPKNSGSNFSNYKKSFSIVLLATCDAFYRFTLVDIGAYGSQHDSTVFKNSGFGRAFLSGSLGIPAKNELRGSNIKMPYFLVADQAFPLHENIMRPYPGQSLGETKSNFNIRLSRARQTIENSFGILGQRWRILLGTMICDVSMSEKIVQACIVLHNYIQQSELDLPVLERRYSPTGYTDYVDASGEFHYGIWRNDPLQMRSVGRLATNNASRANIINRDVLADYFTSDAGSVPWQISKISHC